MQIVLGIIVSFVKKTWQFFNFIRNLIVNLFFAFLIITYINHRIHIDKNIQNKHSWHGALLMDISGTIVDKPTNKTRLSLIDNQIFSNTSNYLQENSLFDIINIIRQAKNDNHITGIVLDLKNFTGAEQSTMQYIGKALREFRHNGKPIIAIGNNYSQGQYYLASFANKIWLSPHGIVDLHGFTTNKLYYKSLLDQLKVSTHVFRVGTYKSAVEPFICNHISQAAKKVDTHWINELWRNYLTTIATNRQTSIQQIFPGAQEMLNKLRKTEGDTAKYALDTKLVDKLGSNVEIEEMLSKLFGWNKKSKKYCAISMYDYMSNKINHNKSGDAIAVIFVNGIIVDGDGNLNNIGSNIITSQIREARLDPKIKAILLRINSPGGSVNASENIREELAATRIVGKPVIVSMGAIAASGGYWIATPASYIFADQNTLTGSIGVFGIINTIEKSLDHLGVHSDGVATSPLADVLITKALPSEVSQTIQLSVENNYKRFINLVANARKKTLEQVEQIAQGYVWTGQDAKNNGLIDSLGDFDDAVAKAIELTKLKHWYLDFYQDKQNILNTVIDDIFKSIRLMSVRVIQNYSPIPSSLVLMHNSNIRNIQITNFNDPKNCYAFCFDCACIY